MPTFAQGFANGFDPNSIVDAWIAHRRGERVAQARLNAYGQPDDPSQQQPAPHPAAALAAIGGQQTPQPQAPPPPFKPGVPPAPGQPDPLAPQPPAPPAPPPGAPTGQAGAEAPTGMSVAPGLADPFKEGQSIIKNMMQTVKAKNPHADPLTIMEAVDQQLDAIKGVAPITKAVMQGQLQFLTLSMKGQQFDERENRLKTEHMQKMLELGQHHANQDAVAEENARFRGEMVGIARDRAAYYGESVDYAHEDRQSAEGGRDARNTQNVQSRERVAEGHNETQEDVAGQRSDDSQYRADQGFRGAQARVGLGAGPAPVRKRGLPPDARKAPDGHFYAKRGGRFVRFD